MFSVDSFGALLPEATQDAADVPEDALTGGMLAWATADSPWAHLPAASGTSLERFLQVMESVPDAEPAVAPSHQEFAHMLAAMMAEPPAPQPVATG